MPPVRPSDVSGIPPPADVFGMLASAMPAPAHQNKPNPLKGGVCDDELADRLADWFVAQTGGSR
jgi:hypothetical protein